jgi:hypothetical protein
LLKVPEHFGKSGSEQLINANSLKEAVMLKMNAVLLSAAVVLGATSLPAAARVNLDIDIGVPPPAPVYEAVPVARPGYVWAPGYWGWVDGRHVWVKGRWIGERRGYHWVPEHWEERGGRHHFVGGVWVR